MCPCGNKYSLSLYTAAIRDQRKGLIPPTELPVLTNPGDQESEDEISDLIGPTFYDASILTYGTAVYLKVEKQNQVLVNLITSKTRVTPLKAVTLSLLEFLEAIVAALLSSKVQQIIRKKKKCKVIHWTYSKIVLFWVKGCSKRWKQFVANRVQITKLTHPDSWFHCSGQDNLSDFLSRGLSADSLFCHKKCWNCPAFLNIGELPETVSECPEQNEEEYLPKPKSKDCKKCCIVFKF
ncbi:integrase catalytic domain-containing protein [Trichonephila clavipes]|nr:integrase catalytic domain-containing protein [Trichonephila clavipes]